jgi:hypothetical protein
MGGAVDITAGGQKSGEKEPENKSCCGRGKEMEEWRADGRRERSVEE